MKYIEHGKETKKTWQDYFNDARNRGVILVISATSGAKRLLIHYESNANNFILVSCDGTRRDYVIKSASVHNSLFSIVGEIDISDVVDGPL